MKLIKDLKVKLTDFFDNRRNEKLIEEQMMNAWDEMDEKERSDIAYAIDSGCSLVFDKTDTHINVPFCVWPRLGNLPETKTQITQAQADYMCLYLNGYCHEPMLAVTYTIPEPEYVEPNQKREVRRITVRGGQSINITNSKVTNSNITTGVPCEDNGWIDFSYYNKGGE